MTGGGGALDRECDVFVRHLASMPANDYVRARYAEAVAARPGLEERPGMDRRLLRLARRGPLRARFADAYAALFAPASALRGRLVILLAILESAPPYSSRIDGPAAAGGARGLLGAILSGIGGVLSLGAGIVILLPMRLLGARGGR